MLRADHGNVVMLTRSHSAIWLRANTYHHHKLGLHLGKLMRSKILQDLKLQAGITSLERVCNFTISYQSYQCEMDCSSKTPSVLNYAKVCFILLEFQVFICQRNNLFFLLLKKSQSHLLFILYLTFYATSHL